MKNENIKEQDILSSAFTEEEEVARMRSRGKFMERETNVEIPLVPSQETGPRRPPRPSRRTPEEDEPADEGESEEHQSETGKYTK